MTDIIPGDFSNPQIVDILNAHMATMQEISPPESIHALDISKLQTPDITFWAAWRDDHLLGVGALKTISAEHGEIKSMHSWKHLRSQGIGTAMLRHIMAVAVKRGMARLSLETGSQPQFEPARALYIRHGFSYCGPFDGYTLDPNSVFMTRELP
jgi:putative acetyltransferase